MGPRHYREVLVWPLLGAAAAVLLWFGGAGALEAARQQREARSAELTRNLDGALAEAAVRFAGLVEATHLGEYGRLPQGFAAELVAFRPSSASSSDPLPLRAAERLEFQDGDVKGAIRSYSRVADDLTRDATTRVLAHWNEARLLRTLGETDRAQARLEEASGISGADDHARLKTAFDLARLGVNQDAFLRTLVAGGDLAFAAVPPGRRAYLHRELGGAAEDSVALRALDRLLDEGRPDAVVTLPGPAASDLLAWRGGTADWSHEVVIGPERALVNEVLPGLAEGRWRRIDGDDGLGPDLPPLSGRFELGPAALEEIDQAGKRALLLRVAGVGVAALLLLAGALYLRVVTRRRAELDARKNNFVCAVTHELKTPLSNIMLYAETLRDAGADDPSVVPRFSRTILDEAERLRLRIQQVLDVAAGRSDPKSGKELFDPAELAEAVVADYRFGAEDRGVTLTLERPDQCPLLRGSSELLAQAIGGLLDNAIKFAGKGMVRVTVADAGGKVAIFVEDDGPGLPPAETERIFEPFVRLGEEMTRRVPGTGLGLTLVRQCVEGLGGRVDARNRGSGVGAVFRIVLDVAEEA